MAFWEIFHNISKSKDKNNNLAASSIQKKIEALLPEATETEQIKIACIAGLLARVAYIDFEISPGEIESMKKIIKDWTSLEEVTINAIVKISIEEIISLSGLENHKYCYPLNDIMGQGQRYEIIIALFAIAAGDGTVAELESEEIRLITKSFNLTHKHYISARATVLNKLKVLKS